MIPANKDSMLTLLGDILRKGFLISFRPAVIPLRAHHAQADKGAKGIHGNYKILTGNHDSGDKAHDGRKPAHTHTNTALGPRHPKSAGQKQHA